MRKLFDRMSYKLAELMFERWLDEDYQLGCNEGERVTRSLMARQIIALISNSPQKYKAGLELALEHIQAER
jgi:hypothetical protein